MMFGGGPLGSLSLGSILQDPGAIADPLAEHPFTLELNGVDRHDWFDSESLAHNDVVGQSATCDFVLVNPSIRPRSGDRVRILYHREVLFAGLLDRIELEPSARHRKLAFRCTCKDWSVVLMRRKIRRNFTSLPIANIVDSLLDNELAGEGFTLGTIDRGPTIPLVDVRNARAFDVLRDVGGATGQSLLVDHDKRIHFLTSTNAPAPKPLTNDTVESAVLIEDVETYRNVQTVIVTGTPASQADDEQTVIVQRSNADQIAARAAIEGGTGRYEEIEEVTHPTANDGVALALMGIGYANLRLATSGTPRRTLRVRVRGYGFRAGQFATVDLPEEQASGSWLIQRCTLQGQFARYLIYELEVAQSSRQQRSYEAWLSIVRAGKVIVQLPGSITNNLETFNTPGTTTWISPITGTVEFTGSGASGGGGGGRVPMQLEFGANSNGGQGGPSGLAVSIIDVVAGQGFDILVGAAGVPGVTDSGNGAGTDGTAGTQTRVSRSGLTVCQGNGGGAGTGAIPFTSNGIDGPPGSGIGDAVSVGGGVAGGARGTTGVQPSAGSDGRVEIRW